MQTKTIIQICEDVLESNLTDSTKEGIFTGLFEKRHISVYQIEEVVYLRREGANIGIEGEDGF